MICLAVLAYPWQLAVLVGTAIGALVHSALATWKRMSRLYRRPASRDLTISGLSRRAVSGGQLAPWEEDQGEREQ